MTAYYNEIDPFAAAWLRELIKRNLIADGVVDERCISDVSADDLKGYSQCHFFAGIGVWSYALRCAGWPDDRPAWTASCPCQPFSTVGNRKGFDDERHLWPAFFGLVRERRPFVIFGEQVAGKDGEVWLDAVYDDLENENYTCGALVAPACGFGAPHQRSRTYWVAYADGEPVGQGGTQNPGDCRQPDGEQDDGVAVRVDVGIGGGSFGLADSCSQGLPVREQQELSGKIEFDQGGAAKQCGGALDEGLPGPVNGFWRDVDWLFCRDGKWRPVESGTFPLVNGATARVGRCRGYGNAIVAPQAAVFIECFMEWQCKLNQHVKGDLNEQA